MDTGTLHAIQSSEFGAGDGPVALMELLPLPAPSTNSWPYHELAGQIPYLQDRASYVAHVLPTRTQRIGELVRQYQPDSVVCYGVGYIRHWEAVFATHLGAITVGQRRCFGGRTGRTQVLVVPHPVRANSNRLWEAIGLHLRGAGADGSRQ